MDRGDLGALQRDVGHQALLVEGEGVDVLADGGGVDVGRGATAILVFPQILKAGLVFGGQTGDGVLLERGQAKGFYNISAGSWGLQAGAQTFGYALFFMNNASLRYLSRSGGFSVGAGPSIVVVNKGAAADVDTTTISQDVYAFPFNQKGLMADITLKGAKITPIHPD